ncbi:MAG TPA: RNA methyltransferase [Terracidiphilus sp.]|jgi:TrmH family RNA methyltransferase
MPVRIIESKQNARLKELRKALAHPGRNERGLVGIEGPNLVEEAMRAGLRIESIFIGSGHGISQPEAGTAAADIDILFVPADYLKSILSTETPQPFAALVEPPDWAWAHLFGGGKRSAPLVVVLAGIQDPGNLGTIIRSAEAFGANGVLCLPGTVSSWNPKAVRASAGSVFRVPVLNVGEEEALTELRDGGVRLVSTTAQGAQPADNVDLSGPVALVIGNEGNGVPAGLAARTDGAVTIPCPGPVESLNAAVAASVLLYEAARQRASKSGGPQELRGGKR